MNITSRISGAFTGWSGETLFKLENGEYWQQSRYAYNYHYAYRPWVTIRQESGRFYLQVDCMDEEIEVIPVDAVESRIDGEFKGWSGDTIFRLQNGQVWQQSAYAYRYKYAYRPEIVIWDGAHLALADDTSDSVQVRRIR